MADEQSIWTEQHAVHLREVRQARGLTQKQLVAMLEDHCDLARGAIDQRHISKIERFGVKRPSPDVLEALHRFLVEFGDGVPIRDHYDRPPTPQSTAVDKPLLSNVTHVSQLSGPDRDELRRQLIAAAPSQIAGMTREGLKALRQVAVWAQLPIDELADGLSDLLSDSQ